MATASPRNELLWLSFLEQIRHFKDTYGHCNVRHDFRDHSLYCWVSRQRDEYQKHRSGERSCLSEQKIAMLETLGFEWIRHSTATSTSLDKFFLKVQPFKDDRGNRGAKPPHENREWGHTQHTCNKSRQGYEPPSSRVTQNDGKSAEVSPKHQVASEKRARGRPKGSKNATNEKFPRPKRPLSAYNMFFKEERERILSSRGFKHQPNENAKPESMLQLNQPDTNKCTGKKKRGRPRGPNYVQRHPKHGKIAFEELGKLVGQNWRSLDPKTKQAYSDRAQAELNVYKREIKLYNAKLREFEEKEKALLLKEVKLYNAKLKEFDEKEKALLSSLDPNQVSGTGLSRDKASMSSTPSKLKDLKEQEKPLPSSSNPHTASDAGLSQDEASMSSAPSEASNWNTQLGFTGKENTMDEKELQPLNESHWNCAPARCMSMHEESYTRAPETALTSKCGLKKCEHCGIIGFETFVAAMAHEATCAIQKF